MPSPIHPSDLELQVLSVLWGKGPQTVRQVQELLPDRKKRAYTTVLTVLQVMEKKGLVAHEQTGLAHVYRPAVSRSAVVRPLLRTLVRNIFGGKASVAVQYLVRDAEASPDELRAIRDLIDEAAKGQKGK